VSKATRSSLLALALIALLPGCSKEGSGTADTKATDTPPAATAAKSADPHPVPSVQPGAEVDLSGIAKADGGKTIAELYAEKDLLAGQKVIVRGKVVKTNAGIMDKNWLHVRDGSGAEGTNDLTVTTTAGLPDVGETVLVTGALAVNKDFGMGYQYPVIVEDAAVTIE
jgi:hypothetical protein